MVQQRVWTVQDLHCDNDDLCLQPKGGWFKPMQTCSRYIFIQYLVGAAMRCDLPLSQSKSKWKSHSWQMESCWFLVRSVFPSHHAAHPSWKVNNHLGNERLAQRKPASYLRSSVFRTCISTVSTTRSHIWGCVSQCPADPRGLHLCGKYRKRLTSTM